MSANGDIVKDALIWFKDIQDCMFSARKDNAAETYEKLKVIYQSLKALLENCGVTMSDIDCIKE